MPILNNLCAVLLCSLKTVIPNPYPEQTMINCVEFHPEKNIFCATYTHSNKVNIYEFDLADNRVKILQSLENPAAQFHEPQHAVFSPDGKKLIVANWSSQTLTLYQQDKDGGFSSMPATTIRLPKKFSKHRFHGISISPCGNFLAIAFGCSTTCGKAIAILRLQDQIPFYSLVSDLGEQALLGIPKGITFTPDGKSLLVTFSDVNCLAIYDINSSEEIIAAPRQIVNGKIYRPEDVKITPKGNYCAVSNSEHNTVTFYPFDCSLNCVTQNEPCYIIEGLAFPHGIAFSTDGTLMAITEFGPINTASDGNVFWDKNTPPSSSRISVFELHNM